MKKSTKKSAKKSTRTTKAAPKAKAEKRPAVKKKEKATRTAICLSLRVEDLNALDNLAESWGYSRTRIINALVQEAAERGNLPLGLMRRKGVDR